MTEKIVDWDKKRLLKLINNTGMMFYEYFLPHCMRTNNFSLACMLILPFASNILS